MEREHRDIPFERYADDVICHCSSEAQAAQLKSAIDQRFAAFRLELHPQKTKIVYCKKEGRKNVYAAVQFDFLGYGFQPRLVRRKDGIIFVSYTPAISQKAAKSIRKEMRSWRVHRWSDLSISDIAKVVNPSLRGWINYYGNYTRSALYRIFEHFNTYLLRWAMMKYKTLRGRRRRAREWVRGVQRREPHLFAHWSMLGKPAR